MKRTYGKRSRRQRGVTLVEALMASVLTAVVMSVTLAIYVTGMMAWTRGEGKILSETGSHAAIRIVANEMRQAMNVTIDPNGEGISYVLPLQDSTGTDVIPIQTDGNTHRIELDGTNLNMVVNGAVARTLCTNVITTDPLSTSGNTPYQIFTSSGGVTVRSMTVEIATKTGSYQSETQSARNRETVFIRNVPQLSL